MPIKIPDRNINTPNWLKDFPKLKVGISGQCLSAQYMLCRCCERLSTTREPRHSCTLRGFLFPAEKNHWRSNSTRQNHHWANWNQPHFQLAQWYFGQAQIIFFLAGITANPCTGELCSGENVHLTPLAHSLPAKCPRAGRTVAFPFER